MCVLRFPSLWIFCLYGRPKKTMGNAIPNIFALCSLLYVKRVKENIKRRTKTDINLVWKHIFPFLCAFSVSRAHSNPCLKSWAHRGKVTEHCFVGRWPHWREAMHPEDRDAANAITQQLLLLSDPQFWSLSVKQYCIKSKSFSAVILYNYVQKWRAFTIQCN